MTNTLTYTLLTTLLFYTSIAWSCTCAYAPYPFCESLDSINHVVMGVVTDKPEQHAIELQVIESLNDTVHADTILILGQDGLNCGQWLVVFEIGDTVILGLYHGQYVDANNQEPYDWYLDGCNYNYLRIENNQVNGAISQQLTNQPYGVFKDGISDCLNLSIGFMPISEQPVVSIRNNPVANFLEVETEAAIIHTIDLYDTNLRLISSMDVPNKQTARLDMHTVPEGLYFVQMKTDLGMVTKKVVKQQ